MSRKGAYLKQNVDSTIKKLNNSLVVVILIMMAIVAYDSYIFNTPLYYMGFFFGGLIIGRVFEKTMFIQFETESQTFTLTKSIFQFVISVLFLVFRFFVGALVLKSFHVVDVSDALYLLFIGIYFSKWRVVLEKIDSIIYEYAFKKSSN